MKIFLFFIFIMAKLSAYDAVIEYSELPLNPKKLFYVWYPVVSQTKGTPSSNPWDIFFVAPDAPIEPSLKKRKLIVLSHGYRGNPHHLSWLIKGLVEQGFVVISLEHGDVIDGRPHVDQWKRPEEIKHLLDAYEKSVFAVHTDLEKVGVVGYSLGGTTALWLAGARATRLDSLPFLDQDKMSQSWRDNRVQAVFAIAPAWSWIIDPQSLRSISIPVYIVASEGDRTLVTESNAVLFAKYIPHAKLHVFGGKGNHFVFITRPDPVAQRKINQNRTLDFIFTDDPAVERSAIQHEIVEQATDFFRNSLK